MEPQKGIKTESAMVCKLRKTLQKLKHAPLCWNSKFNVFAKSQNLKQCENNSCLYSIKIDKSVLYIRLYVDDIINAGIR